MKVGIVGTGIAGLTAGWLFEQAGHKVVLFEKMTSLGISAHSLEIVEERGRFWVDVPPRMFNDAQWPNLVRLYDHLGVDYEPVDLSKSFSHFGGKGFLNLHASYKPKLSRFLLSKNVRQIAADVNKMMNHATDPLVVGSDLTLRGYLQANHYSDAFVFDFLYPSLSSTVCTCSYASLDNYPASLILRTLVDIIGRDLSESRPLMRTKFGSHDVARRLSGQCNDIRFETTVLSATEYLDQVRVVFKLKGNRFEEEFDHLIAATQANQSLQFLSGLNDRERQTLESFRYENVESVVHTDESLMPDEKSNWAHFNFVIKPDESMCSVWMNRFDQDSPVDGNIFQTIGPIVNPLEQRVLARRKLQRPAVNLDSFAAWETIARLHLEPGRRIWFCGSYASDGVPLLESGVVSSLNVAESLGIELPDAVAPSIA